MKPKEKSTTLSESIDKSLSGWDRAILEAKCRIKELKVSIRGFEELRDSGAKWPEPTSGSKEKDLGQDGLLGQSPSKRLPQKSELQPSSAKGAK